MKRIITLAFASLCLTFATMLTSCSSYTPEQIQYRNNEYAEGLKDVTKARNSSRKSAQKHVQAALTHFHNAAQLDHTQSLVAIGDYYSGGHFTQKNWPEALRWYEKAAKSGGFFIKDHKESNILACKQLAFAYFNGRPGVYKSRSKALRWFKRGGNLGDADMQAMTGYLLLEEARTLDDYQEVINWLYRAGNNGNKQAKRDARAIKNEVARKVMNGYMNLLIEASRYTPPPMEGP